MIYTVHPVWSTTIRSNGIWYGLYRVCAQGEIEIARACRLDTIETLRRNLLRHNR